LRNCIIGKYPPIQGGVSMRTYWTAHRLATGRANVEERFRVRAQELGLIDRVLQIPFLPHWRVPEFLRGCLAVCRLEQNFPIGFHSPITPLEVLLYGACLVGSTEVIRKLGLNDSTLVDGYRMPHPTRTHASWNRGLPFCRAPE
jgi:hypothetical protein